jgi:hypothetical protein
MRGVLALAIALAGCSGAFAAEGGVWSVSKSSGEVWLTTTGATPASLTKEATLKPGDTVRTGPNGRVLLMRGEETILVSPNSVIGLPTEQKDGLSTTILQQAGSILLDVEKRNVKHFEVETPYLAAVVKGTHFQVTVNASNTRVDVQRGQVEVADFKTGQIAQVMPGQAATSFVHGKPGLSLSGSGTFNPIEQGKPRASTIERVSVPRNGLHAPHGTGEGKSIRALGPAGASPGKLADQAGSSRISTAVNSHVIRLTNALGEVHLNVHQATHGLAHSAGAPGVNGNASRDTARNTIWSDSNSTTSVANASAGNGNGNGNGNGGGNSSGNGGGVASSPGGSSVVGAVTQTAGGVTGAVLGDLGIGNGATGNGNHGNGLLGNLLGNGGVGNGRGNGNAKH